MANPLRKRLADPSSLAFLEHSGEPLVFGQHWLLAIQNPRGKPGEIHERAKVAMHQFFGRVAGKIERSSRQLEPVKATFRMILERYPPKSAASPECENGSM
jgi:hypothetical protein